MRVFDLLTDQERNEFTGSIEIKKLPSLISIGSLFFSNGIIINSRIRGIETLAGLYSIIDYCISHDDHIEFHSTPSKISNSDKRLYLKPSLVVNDLIENSDLYARVSDYKPPLDMWIEADPSFVRDGAKVTSLEFDTLCTVAEFNKISKIYKNSLFYHKRTTLNLVKLKKNGALVLKRG